MTEISGRPLKLRVHFASAALHSSPAPDYRGVKMSDEGECEFMEELLTRHRKEKKELKAHIQHLKKQINKDKKKKKETGEEIERLERELKEQHEEELTALRASQHSVSSVSDGVTAVSLEDGTQVQSKEDETSDAPTPEQDSVRKVSKAEKRRQKKAEANRERESRIREAAANNKYSARSVEAEKLKVLMRERKLKMVDIQPDGNCMYAAIVHQLGGDTTVAVLRAQAAQFIRAHYDDFSPFITDPDSGEMLTPDQFSDYCNRVETTPLWGGQPELRALSQVMKRRIEVLQAEGSPIVFGESYCEEKGVLLTYYHHYYGLGEHYNSVASLRAEANDKES